MDVCYKCGQLTNYYGCYECYEIMCSTCNKRIHWEQYDETTMTYYKMCSDCYQVFKTVTVKDAHGIVQLEEVPYR